MKIAITGANSSVGKQLLTRLSAEQDLEVIAGVRAEKAFADLPQAASITPQVIAYTDAAALATVMAGCDCVIHLAGILIESKHTNYTSANVEATAAVLQAARQAGVGHVLFISVVGADADSSNAYFRSKGAAERLVADSGIDATILRTPILLGPGTAGAEALLGVSGREQAKLLGGGHYTQRPLDIDDLNEAILRICQTRPPGVTIHELVGPEPIKYRDLIQRMASLRGRNIQIGSVPLWLAKLGAAVSSSLRGGGVNPTVIDVITMDEEVNNNADAALGISLTPLDTTLSKLTTAAHS